MFDPGINLTPRDYFGNQAIVPHVERNTSMRVAVDDVRSQWLQAEERSKQLNERLSTAFADITAKDNLVKQHVKVAEEAVTGTNSFPLLCGHHRIT